MRKFKNLKLDVDPFEAFVLSKSLRIMRNYMDWLFAVSSHKEMLQEMQKEHHEALDWMIPRIEAYLRAFCEHQELEPIDHEDAVRRYERLHEILVEKQIKESVKQ